MKFLSYQQGRARCGLDVYQLRDGRYAVLLTELPDNKGKSVTNAVETLASSIAFDLELPVPKLLFVEHYLHSPDRGGAETFDEVCFNWRGTIASTPVWVHRGPAWWHSLIEGARER